MYADPIEQLIKTFSRLPGIGRRAAERFVFFLLKSGKKDVAELTIALNMLIQKIKSCEVCWNFSDQTPCIICTDTKRDHNIICVVRDSQEVQAIEKTAAFHGVYHVLRGTIKPEDENSLKFLKIKELLVRSKKENIKEVILALNPDLSGETTMMILEKHLMAERPNLIVTRLARGLPMGSDLKYADDITLASALNHRIKNN